MHSDRSDRVVAAFAQFAGGDQYAPQFYGRFAKSSLYSFVQLALTHQAAPRSRLSTAICGT